MIDLLSLLINENLLNRRRGIERFPIRPPDNLYLRSGFRDFFRVLRGRDGISLVLAQGSCRIVRTSKGGYVGYRLKEISAPIT